MNAERIRALILSFERCIQLNQELLQLLEKGETLEALAQHFAQKEQVLGKLRLLAGSLDGSTDSSTLTVKALAVQARAARLETQVSEALGKRQKQGSGRAIIKAYSGKKLDKKVLRHLDVES